MASVDALRFVFGWCLTVFRLVLNTDQGDLVPAMTLQLPRRRRLLLIARP